jgi:hypothetical protein
MAKVVRPQVENQLEVTSSNILQLDPYEVHADWQRWITASINKHFIDRRSISNLYLEGDERTQQDNAEFAELRIDGPFILVPQKGLYYLDLEINILIQAHPDLQNLYNIQTAIGIFSKAFTNSISIYAYGDGPLDDGSLIECLHLQRDLREAININNYGIIKPDVRLMQSTVEGHYRLEIWKLRS